MSGRCFRLLGFGNFAGVSVSFFLRVLVPSWPLYLTAKLRHQRNFWFDFFNRE